jgi:hypothetical protein
MDSGISHSQIPSNTEYENLVELNYQLYNGLFLTLPLDGVQQTGVLLPLLETRAQKGLANGEIRPKSWPISLPPTGRTIQNRNRYSFSFV